MSRQAVTPNTAPAARWADYWRHTARADVVAALVVSVLLIPQSLAYAQLAGLPPAVGMLATLAPLVAYAALGSSPVLGVGPAALLALLVAQTLAGLPAGIPPVGAAAVLAFEVGALLWLAAWLRLDALAALLSVPVLNGFEAGAAVSIALSQWPALVGAEGAKGWARFTTLNPTGALVGMLAVLALILIRRGAAKARPAQVLWWRLAPLLVLVAATAYAYFGQATHRGLGTVGELPLLSEALGHINGAAPWGAMAPWQRPDIWLAVMPAAASIALLAYITSWVVAESLARKLGHRVSARRELAGLAAANWASAFSGAMPVAGSFSRSLLQADAGARSRASGVFTAIFMALALWALHGPLAWLPRPVLAATIITAVLANLRLAPFRRAWRYAPPEAAVMTLVAVVAALGSLQAALALGVAASVALLLNHTAHPHVVRLGQLPGTEHYRNVERHAVTCTPGVLQLRVDESLLFTNARLLGGFVAEHLAQEPSPVRRVVLQMTAVNAIDLSGLEALHDLQTELATQGIRLDLSELKGPVLDRLKTARWQRWFKGQAFVSHHQAMQV